MMHQILPRRPWRPPHKAQARCLASKSSRSPIQNIPQIWRFSRSTEQKHYVMHIWSARRPQMRRDKLLKLYYILFLLSWASLQMMNWPTITLAEWREYISSRAFRNIYSDDMVWTPELGDMGSEGVLHTDSDSYVFRIWVFLRSFFLKEAYSIFESNEHQPLTETDHRH
jgi:hypothetical protein